MNKKEFEEIVLSLGLVVTNQTILSKLVAWLSGLVLTQSLLILYLILTQ